MKIIRINASERDWVDELHTENGNYKCYCAECKETFTGHKRRTLCFLCAKKYTSLNQKKEDKNG